jgi:hypothetical protein
MLEQVWLVHPDKEMCDAFHRRFAGLPRVRVIQGRFEDLEPHDCFVTAGNAFGIMSAGIDAAVVRRFGSNLMHRVQHHIIDQFYGEQPVGTAFIVSTEDASIPFIVHAPTAFGYLPASSSGYPSWIPFLNILEVPPAGVEPATSALGKLRSIHLSYGGVTEIVNNLRRKKPTSTF